MSSIAQALLTTGLTIFGGLLVFVAGQVFLKLALEPLQALRMTIGMIARDLLFWSNVFTQPGSGDPDRLRECAEVLRTRSSELSGGAQAIGPLLRLCARLRLLPGREELAVAHRGLIFLSGSVYRGEALENDAKRKSIQEALRIPEEFR